MARNIEQEMEEVEIRFAQILEILETMTNIVYAPDGGMMHEERVIPGLLGLDVKGALWRYDYGMQTWAPFSTRKSRST